MEEEKKYSNDYFHEVIAKLINVIIILIIVIIVMFVLLYTGFPKQKAQKTGEELKLDNKVENTKLEAIYWNAPDTAAISKENNAEQIFYGKNLIKATSFYFGPQGKINQSTNGMNCQNCHLEAGTKTFGNNYSAVYSTYPKFRERSGTFETIAKRVNDCFERSLNGASIDTNGTEMKAIIAYMKWLGKDVAKNEKPKGAGLKSLDFLNRAADVTNGQKIYETKCISCHQMDGEGKLNPDKKSFQYPPLWGANSYNDGAGLYRLTRFAAFIKYNMPQGARFENPQLSDEEAWDLAAFVNSQRRPKKDLSKDWPNIKTKPIDHPFGPFADAYTERQHKYGPFAAIEEARKLNKK